ncbi:MAG: pyridoxal phosphate-dependent aminotransferase [Candidatus Omnitrophica bacterium]|nr:pyridoxal phosphate-dependent aminotransferase [Candidatus Omnitrophota bacterium]
MKTIQFSHRIEQVGPSQTLAITHKAKKMKQEGHDVISFGAGEPDLDTPEFIKNAAIDALKKGMTKYSPTSGLPDFKKAIIEKFEKDNGLKYSSDEIIVSNGAKHSLFNAFQVLLNEGDQVLIPSPYWLSYPEMVRLSGGEPVFIETNESDRFKIKPKDLENKISSRAKVLVINSPSNPTGVIYDRSELEEISRIAVKHGLFVISDEIYEKLIYDGKKHVSIASLNTEIKNVTLTVNGMSKAYSMTGWRLGYLAGPREIVEKMDNFQSHATSNPNTFAQYGAVEALLKGGEEIAKMRDVFETRRNLMARELDKISKCSYVCPDGAFYFFVNISKTGMDGARFAEKLLEKQVVAVVPGDVFGSARHIRLSFATSEQNIMKGISRIADFLK